MPPGVDYCAKRACIYMNDEKLSKAFALLQAALLESEAQPQNAPRRAGSILCATVLNETCPSARPCPVPLTLTYIPLPVIT